MEVFAIILSGLALLAASVCLTVTVREKKRSEKQRAALLHYVESVVKPMEDSIKKLENGVMPDYEKAMEAAKAVNDFNAGLSAIMGFDPYEALRREQKKEQLGGEVE